LFVVIVKISNLEDIDMKTYLLFLAFVICSTCLMAQQRIIMN